MKVHVQVTAHVQRPAVYNYTVSLDTINATRLFFEHLYAFCGMLYASCGHPAAATGTDGCMPDTKKPLQLSDNNKQHLTIE